MSPDGEKRNGKMLKKGGLERVRNETALIG